MGKSLSGTASRADTSRSCLVRSTSLEDDRNSCPDEVVDVREIGSSANDVVPRTNDSSAMNALNAFLSYDGHHWASPAAESGKRLSVTPLQPGFGGVDVTLGTYSRLPIRGNALEDAFPGLHAQAGGPVTNPRKSVGTAEAWQRYLALRSEAGQRAAEMSSREDTQAKKGGRVSQVPRVASVESAPRGVRISRLLRGDHTGPVADHDGKKVDFRLSAFDAVLKQDSTTEFRDPGILEDYIEQFKAVFKIQSDEGEEVGGDSPSLIDYFFFVVLLPWKLLFAFICPTRILGGWPCFFMSFIFIGGVTAVVADMAYMLGCVCDVPNEITAITFVALGTSVPDTFASMTAARKDEHADASVGNVTGSNSVNVFVGLGLSWLLASSYWASRNQEFAIPAGPLVFSVSIFCVGAFCCLFILRLRRVLFGGELGGPHRAKMTTSLLLTFYWAVYVVLSTLVVTGGNEVKLFGIGFTVYVCVTAVGGCMMFSDAKSIRDDVHDWLDAERDLAHAMQARQKKE